jgi:hypothetical protein
MAGAVKSACGQKNTENPLDPLLGRQNHRFWHPLGIQNAEKASLGGFGKNSHFWTTKKLCIFRIWARFWGPQGYLWGLIFDPAHATHQLGGGGRALLGAFRGLEAFFAPIFVKICYFSSLLLFIFYRFSLYFICFPSRWFRIKIAITTKAPSQAAWS